MSSKRLREIQKLFSVSGEEERMGKLFLEAFQKQGLKIASDRLGSVFGIHKSKTSGAYRVMVSSPLDRYGFMINDIHEDGTLGFLPLENMHPSSLLHQRVQILTRSYQLLEGVICDKAHHYAESFDHEVKGMCIDTGRTFQEASRVFTIGDVACLHADMEWLNTHYISASSLHPAIFNEVVLEVMEELVQEEFPFDLALGGIGQSMIGYRGAKTITHVLQPDVSLVLTGFDGRCSNDGKTGGVLIGAFDKGMIPNRRLYQDVQDVLHAGMITGALPNDGSFIHKTQKGAAAISIGIFVRNMATAVEMADERDIDALKEAICTYLRALTPAKIKQFTFGREK